MKEQTHSFSFLVVDVPSIPILGLQACTQFGLVKKTDSVTELVRSVCLIFGMCPTNLLQNVVQSFFMLFFHRFTEITFAKKRRKENKNKTKR